MQVLLVPLVIVVAVVLLVVLTSWLLEERATPEQRERHWLPRHRG